MLNERVLLAVACVCVAGSAHAQGFTDFTPTSTSYIGWGVDRALPDTFQITTAPDGSGNNALQIGVTPATYNSTYSFYNYEGEKKNVGFGSDGWTASADLYVSQDMVTGTNPYDAEFWTRDNSPSYDELTTAWYGTMEYLGGNLGTANLGYTAPGFYYWDPNTNINNLVLAAPTAGNWYTLAMSEVGTTMNYYLNGTLVKSYAGAETVDSHGDTYTGLGSVFLEEGNYNATSTNYWQNVQVKTPASTPEPVTLGLGVAAIGMFLRRRVKARLQLPT